MKLEYADLLSPAPIKLSVGTVKKHTLREIASISFDRFLLYESLLKMTPKLIFTKLIDGGEEYWEALDEDEKEKASLYDIIMSNETILKLYLDMFDFFFVETVRVIDGMFVVLKKDASEVDDITENDISGVITDKNFDSLRNVIQQICCIQDKSKESGEKPRFKNKVAQALYEKMKRAEEADKAAKAKKYSREYSIPNIISAVSNRHPSLNPINIWDLTIFQLLDSFNRLQTNAVYDMNSTHTSVWGDEKKTFDETLWFRYNHND